MTTTGGYFLFKCGKALIVTGLAVAALVVWLLLVVMYVVAQVENSESGSETAMGVAVALAVPLSIAILWVRHMLVACCSMESCYYGLFVIGATASIEIFMLLLTVAGEFAEQTVMQSFTLLFLAGVVTYQGLSDPLYTHSARLSWVDSRWGAVCMLLSAVEFALVLGGTENDSLSKALFVSSLISIAIFLYAAVIYFCHLVNRDSEAKLEAMRSAKFVV